MTKWRGALIALVATLVLPLVAACGAHDGSGWSSGRIATGKATELRIDDVLKLQVPQGAAPVGATIRARKRQPTLPETSYLGPLASLEIELSSGQPTAPLRLILTLSAPLPATREAFAVYPSQTAAPKVIPATLSGDRRTVAVDLPHLSLLDIDWSQIGNADLWSATFGELFGTRFEGPQCQGNAPRWASAVDFLAGDINSPLLVCTGRDPADESVLVVKIVNNRGLGLTVTTPVAWDWVWLSGNEIGVMPAVVNGLAAVMQRLNMPDPDRSVILAPGQEVDFGFRESAFASTTAASAITAKPDLVAVVFGLAWIAAENTMDNPMALTAMELGILTRCMADAGLQALNDVPDFGTATKVGFDVLQCVAGNIGPIVDLAIELLPADFWNAIKKPALEAGRVLKVGVDRYLLIINAAWSGLDAAATLELWRTVPAAFAVTIHRRISAPPAAQCPTAEQLSAALKRYLQVAVPLKVGPCERGFAVGFPEQSPSGDGAHAIAQLKSGQWTVIYYGPYHFSGDCSDLPPLPPSVAKASGCP